MVVVREKVESLAVLKFGGGVIFPFTFGLDL